MMYAIEFLMEEYGMTMDEAVAYVGAEPDDIVVG